MKFERDNRFFWLNFFFSKVQFFSFWFLSSCIIFTLFIFKDQEMGYTDNSWNAELNCWWRTEPRLDDFSLRHVESNREPMNVQKPYAWAYPCLMPGVYFVDGSVCFIYPAAFCSSTRRKKLRYIQKYIQGKWASALTCIYIPVIDQQKYATQHERLNQHEEELETPMETRGYIRSRLWIFSKTFL